jgi:predicted nucleotidyltransferase
MVDREDLISAVKNTVREVAPNSKIILFGSRSRNDFSEESDWDFLILTEEEATENHKEKIRAHLFEIELNTNQSISSIIHSKKEWENFKITPLYQTIEDEGVAV